MPPWTGSRAADWHLHLSRRAFGFATLFERRLPACRWSDRGADDRLTGEAPRRAGSIPPTCRRTCPHRLNSRALGAIDASKGTMVHVPRARGDAFRLHMAADSGDFDPF